MIEHRISHSAVAPALPDRVWEGLQVPEVWTSFPGIDRIVDPVIERGQLVEFAFRGDAAGRARKGSLVVVVSRFPHSMTVRIAERDLREEIVVSLAPSGTAATDLTATLIVQALRTGAKRTFAHEVAVVERTFLDSVENLALASATVGTPAN